MARGEEDRELEEFLRSVWEDKEMHRTFSNDGPPPPQSHLHRVPERLRKMKESAYTPSLVSIGPIHKNATHLKDMEKVKLRSLSGSVRQDLLLLENQIPYSVLQELFNKCKSPEDPPLPTLVFNFFETIVTFGGSVIAKSRFDDYIEQGRDIPHILHLLHISILPPDSSEGILPSSFLDSQQREFVPSVSLQIESEKSEFARIVRHSATELDRSGLKFVAGEGENLSLSFSSPETNSTSCYSWMRWWCARSIVGIPKLYIHDSTEPLLRNLIAYEQCYTGKHLYLTSYAYLMDTLINSVEDVELLEGAGVLQNNLGSSEKVLHLFNNLCNEIFLGEKFYFFEIWKKVDNYYKKWWLVRNIAKLRRHYFSNPWTLISVLAGLVLFILTLLQTIYTIRG